MRVSAAEPPLVHVRCSTAPRRMLRGRPGGRRHRAGGAAQRCPALRRVAGMNWHYGRSSALAKRRDPLSPVGAGAGDRQRRIRGRPAPADGTLARWLVRSDRAMRAGRRYRYRLADGMLVPDPASRAQANDVHDPSVVVDPSRYAWRNTAWRGRPWRETVLYELHAGVLGGFRWRRTRASQAGRPRRHRRRADAGQRFSRPAQLGI